MGGEASLPSSHPFSFTPAPCLLPSSIHPPSLYRPTHPRTSIHPEFAFNVASTEVAGGVYLDGTSEGSSGLYFPVCYFGEVAAYPPAIVSVLECEIVEMECSDKLITSKVAS